MMQLDYMSKKVKDYTFVLSLRNHEHLGQLRNVDPESVDSKLNFNGANELSFTVYKYNDYEKAKEAEKINNQKVLDELIEPLWDEITDFKFIYVPDLNEYYEIKVDKILFSRQEIGGICRIIEDG